MAGTLFLLLAALALSALFAGSETAYYAVNRLRLEHEPRPDWRQRLLAGLTRNPAFFLATLLVGNNLANQLAEASSRALLGAWQVPPWASLLVLTPVVFLVGEVGPKQFMLHRPERRLLAVAPVLALCRILFLPLALPLVFVARVLRGGGEEAALGRAQLARLFLEGRRSAHPEAAVLQAAYGALSSRGRGLRSFLRPRVPILPVRVERAAALQQLREASPGFLLLREPGSPRPWLLLPGDRLVLAPPELPPRELARPIPALDAAMDLAAAVQRLARSGAAHAVVLEEGQVLGVLDLEAVLLRLLDPEGGLSRRPPTPIPVPS